MLNLDIRKTLVALLAICLVMGPLDAFAGKKRSKKKKAKPVAEAPERPAAPPPAPPPPPKPVTTMDDASMLAAETVAVQPVFMVGAEADTAWSHVAAQMRMGKPGADAAKALAGHGIDAPAKAEGGFGFAGASSETDIKILHYGIALGFTTALSRIGQGKDAKSIGEGLARAAGLLSSLTPAAQESAKALVALAMGTAKEDAGTLLAKAVRAGMLGIAAGPQRAHGYYITGVWAGASVLVGMLGGSQVWADMGEPLAILLEKDAAFGGSDRELAKHVRAISAQLRGKTPDVRAITASLKAMRAVKADSAKPAAAAAPAADAKPADAKPAEAKPAAKAAK